ncbi:DUF1302 domain-containing protein [Zoogloea sp. LCSB751]|uniref:DUF1302 domain-containing protein n=1 Tax=Zoogloea sp. LCSB751 TaxID=1965277 RepID=UPI0020B1587C|nr:DUF1302 domain-containing protein [Zoogloea sp. LCSB751]
MKNRFVSGIPRRRMATAVTVAAASLAAGQAMAFQIPTAPESDVEIRWDNTVKYNVGMRTKGRDASIYNTWLHNGSDGKFDKGDLVTNRVDLLSEFDFVVKKNYGFRLSGAAWYDAAYNDKFEGNPALAALPSPYAGNRYTDTVKRYYTKSGELLDAFVFGRLDIGDVPVNVKFGRHTIYWGESLFTPIHGVSYSQGPVDFRKALATPGSEAKELYLPLSQLSAQAQLNDTVSVAAQYYLEWAPYRLPEGGTYLASADPFFAGGTNVFGTPYLGDRSGHTPGNRGSWGVNTKLTPEWLQATVGLYYRHFDDKVPTILANPAGYMYNAYAQDVRLWGVSVSKQISGIAFGAELVRRDNGALNTVSGASQIARGATWHGLVNALAYVGKTAVFDSATLMAELSYSRLAHVDEGSKALFGGDKYGACSGVKSGCSTDSAYGVSATFTPTWFQALPSVDITLPVHYDIGLKGNSPVPFGGNENSGTWSIGVGAEYMAKYKFDLAYTNYFGNYLRAANGTVAAFNGNAAISDRSWLSFTFKTTF